MIGREFINRAVFDWFNVVQLLSRMVKTFAYVQNEVSQGVNSVRVFINKNSYTLTEGIGYFRLISFTLNTLQGSVVHTEKTPGKVSQHKNVQTHYTEYMHLVDIPADEKTVVDSILQAGFKKV